MRMLRHLSQELDRPLHKGSAERNSDLRSLFGGIRPWQRHETLANRLSICADKQTEIAIGEFPLFVLHRVLPHPFL